MNYYNEIKIQIINNKLTKKVKDCSKNKSNRTKKRTYRPDTSIYELYR